MNETLYKSKENLNLIEDLSHVIIAQLLKDMDDIRTRQFWSFRIPYIPNKVLAEVLALGIRNGASLIENRRK